MRPSRKAAVYALKVFLDLLAAIRRMADSPSSVDASGRRNACPASSTPPSACPGKAFHRGPVGSGMDALDSMASAKDSQAYRASVRFSANGPKLSASASCSNARLALWSVA